MRMEAFALARSSWLADLGNIRTEEQLLVLAWEFLDQWSTLEVARLPAGAWPMRPRCADDLVDLALRLERIQSAYGEGGSRELRELGSFFSQVSIRALRLQLARGR